MKSQACHKSVRKKGGTRGGEKENHFRSLYISLMDFAPVAPAFQCCSVTLPCSLKQRPILCDIWDFQGKSHCDHCSTSRGAPASPCSAKNPNPLAAQDALTQHTAHPSACSGSSLPQPSEGCDVCTSPCLNDFHLQPPVHKADGVLQEAKRQAGTADG